MRSPLSLVLAGMLATTAAPALAQHGPGAHSHTGAVPSTGHLTAQACLAEFDAVVAEGRGFGMAFPADQNGYPGPLHVLELKDRLRLSRDQEAKAEVLLAAMFAESRPKSSRLLDAEAKLRRLFAASRPDEAAVRTAVGEVETARADVRLVHLLFHLKMRDALTDEQRRAYQEARWGGPTPTR